MQRNRWPLILYAVFAFVFWTTMADGNAAAQHVERFFFNGSDGDQPVDDLIRDTADNLYGVTFFGGNGGCSFGGCGVVFEFTPPVRGSGVWTESTLHQFQGPDGSYPSGSLVLDDAGNLYGTTYGGGIVDGGLVFELSPPTWNETVLYTFGCGSE